MSKRGFHVAIDGPVAAGKGTISRLVADRLGFLYIDTGAMYRVTALLGLKNDCSWDDGANLAKLVGEARIEMRNPTETEKDGRLTTVLVNGEDVSWSIRTEKVSSGASKVAVHKEVRAVLVEKQREIAEGQNVVMEGRDITSRVLPEADLKIYMTANDVVRAKRRHFQLLTRGEDVEFDEVYKNVIERDKLDSERAEDPLTIVDDAWVVDSSDLSVDQVVDLIVAKVELMHPDFEG